LSAIEGLWTKKVASTNQHNKKCFIAALPVVTTLFYVRNYQFDPIVTHAGSIRTQLANVASS